MPKIKTELYHENDVVIDSVAGSGSTLRAAAELGRNSYGFETSKDFYNKAVNIMLKDCATTADVKIVVRSEWIDDRNCTAYCSNCGELRLGNSAESLKKYKLANFCEHCGADMRGGEEK